MLIGNVALPLLYHLIEKQLNILMIYISGAGEMTEMIDTIFVTGLNEAITEDALVNHFGSIGVIKVHIYTHV